MTHSNPSPSPKPSSSTAKSNPKLILACQVFENYWMPQATRPVILLGLSLISFCMAVKILRGKGIDSMSLLKIRARYTAILLIGLGILAYGIICTILYDVLKQYIPEDYKLSFMIFNLLFGLMLLVLPSKVGLCWWERKNFLLAFLEILVGRSDRPGVPFRLVVLADIFTSYARIGIDYFDLLTDLFLLMNQKSITGSTTFKIFLAVLSSFALLFRLRQCLSEWRRNRSPRHLVNGLKYFMGIMIVVVGKVRNPLEGSKTAKMNLIEKWFCFAVYFFSTLLSLGWDLLMDWNISFTGFRSYAPTSTPLQSTTSLAISADNAETLNSSSEQEQSSQDECTEAEAPLIPSGGQQQHEESSALPPQSDLPDSDQESAGGPKKQEPKMGRFSTLFYAYVILFNIFGRSLNLLKALCYFSLFSQTLSIYLSDSSTKGIQALIEAYRRFNWILLRVENHHSQVLFVENSK